MSLVQDVTPINLEQEKKKFFESDFAYNPQFKYKSLVTKNKLLHYGRPKEEYLKLASQIVTEAFNNRTEAEIRAVEGEVLDREQAQSMIDQFLNKNDLSDLIKVKYSKNFVSHASYYKNLLKIKIPIKYRLNEFKATLYHELGTHALRRVNYTQQPFFKKKKKNGFKDYMRTEEGLASFHSLLAKRFKLNFTSALNYLAVKVAQEKSFDKTFAFIMKYLDDPEYAWKHTTKNKRGLYDTSKPGGFTLGIVYFEGMFEVWNFLKKYNFDLRGLYLGKISCQDISLARELNPKFEPQLPHFYTRNPEKYKKEIKKIAAINHLTD